MLPIVPGLIPFGAVMGTICADSKLSYFQTLSMNIFVFAGSSQLAATDLMLKNTPALVVVLTGLIINLRFVLYSAALSPIVQKSGFLVKALSSYLLTDQSYATMSANEDKLTGTAQLIEFYFGAATLAFVAWQLSVLAGLVFGNFAPASWSLEYAIPLSFITLVIPTLKNRKYIIVALFSAVVSVLLKPIPYNLGLIMTALLGIALSVFLSRKKGAT